VLLIWDFNVPNFDWERGLPLPKCYYYSKLKGDSTSLLGLTQRLLTYSSLDLLFTNFDRVGAFFANVGVVKPDAFHSPIVIEIPLDLHNLTLRHIMRIPTANMHQVTIVCYLAFFLILSGRVCTVTTQ
jgi:hypothetical protein